MAGIALAFAVLRIDDSATVLGWVVAAWTIPMVASRLVPRCRSRPSSRSIASTPTRSSSPATLSCVDLALGEATQRRKLFLPTPTCVATASDPTACGPAQTRSSLPVGTS